MIKIDLPDVQRQLEAAIVVFEGVMPRSGNTDIRARRHAAFGVARGLTRTAAGAKAALVSHLADSFQIRNTWVASGIVMYKATTKDLEASVGSRDRFMALQATGGDKEGKGGKSVAVPELGTARRTIASITKPGKWPGRLLLDKKRYFIKPLAGGNEGVFRRLGKGGRTSVQLWYVIAKRVKVQQRWPFGDIVINYAKANLQQFVADSLREKLLELRNVMGLDK